MDETEARARDILTKRDGDLKAIAQRLLDKEVLEGEELQALTHPQLRLLIMEQHIELINYGELA